MPIEDGTRTQRREHQEGSMSRTEPLTYSVDEVVLTVVDFADEAFIENADVQSGVGRRGDGVFVTVTLIGVKPGAVGVGCSAR
jgi:hypothetical protein